MGCGCHSDRQATFVVAVLRERRGAWLVPPVDTHTHTHTHTHLICSCTVCPHECEYVWKEEEEEDEGTSQGRHAADAILLHLSLLVGSRFFRPHSCLA